MSFQSTALIARKSIRARFGRLIAISIAILVGVSFVVGSFVLADSLRKTFDDLFTQISQNVDLEVRASVAFGEDSVDVQRDPIPASLADQVAQVEGVAAAEPLLQRYAQLVDQDGEPITTQGAPTLGVAWTGDESLSGLEIKGEGRPPSGSDEVAIDKATRRPGGLRRRRHDRGDHRHRHARRSRSPPSSGSATATGSPAPRWRRGTSPTAQEVTGAIDQFDGVDVAVEEGRRPGDGAGADRGDPPRTAPRSSPARR